MVAPLYARGEEISFLMGILASGTIISLSESPPQMPFIQTTGQACFIC